MNRQLLLGFKDLFPEEEPLLVSQYLEGISRADLIRIALFFIHREDFSKPETYFSSFVDPYSPHFAKRMLLRLKQLVEDKPDVIYTFGESVTGLKLLQYIFASPAISETTKNEAEIIESITKAVSLINQNSIGDSDLEKKGVNQDSLLSTIREEGDSDEFILAKMFFCNQVVYADFLNFLLNPLFIAQMLKVDRFFKFCNTEPDFKKLSELFLEKHGCNLPKEYLKPFSEQIIHFINNPQAKNEYPIVKLRPDDVFGLKLFPSISLKINEVLPMKDNYDSLAFRNKPLIQVSDDEFLVINKAFFIEHLYNSIKFNLDEINKKEKVKKDFFSDYTTHFSEQFLFNTLVKNSYKPYRYKLVEGGPGRCDYLVRNGNKIFLFECKDIEYASKIKQSDDFSEIKGYIWEKLVQKKGKPIGAGQLVRDIKDISDGTTTWEEDLPKNLQVFPILVLGKPIFSNPGFNYMMNKWFIELLDQESIDSRIKINPLVVIDIDTFLFLEESLKTKRIKLETEIKNYYNFIKKAFMDEQAYTSFSNYIQEQRNKYVFSESSGSVFAQTIKEALFGED